MSVDLQQAGMLLHVIDLAKNWPTLKGIHDLAMAELNVLNVQALEELGEQAKAVVEAKAEAYAKAAAEAQAKAEREKQEADRAARVPPPRPPIGADQRRP